MMLCSNIRLNQSQIIYRLDFVGWVDGLIVNPTSYNAYMLLYDAHPTI